MLGAIANRHTQCRAIRKSSVHLLAKASSLRFRLQHAYAGLDCTTVSRLTGTGRNTWDSSPLIPNSAHMLRLKCLTDTVIPYLPCESLLPHCFRSLHHWQGRFTLRPNHLLMQLAVRSAQLHSIPFRNVIVIRSRIPTVKLLISYFFSSSSARHGGGDVYYTALFNLHHPLAYLSAPVPLPDAFLDRVASQQGDGTTTKLAMAAF